MTMTAEEIEEHRRQAKMLREADSAAGEQIVHIKLDDFDGFLSALEAAEKRAEEAEAKAASKTFPIQKFGPIPWKVAQFAYHEYAKKYGHGQSMERLAERGGFGVGEMDMLYPAWRSVVLKLVELTTLRARVAEMEGALKNIDRMTYKSDGDCREMIRARIHAALKKEPGNDAG